jgi:hypothetical protein
VSGSKVVKAAVARLLRLVMPKPQRRRIDEEDLRLVQLRLMDRKAEAFPHNADLIERIKAGVTPRGRTLSLSELKPKKHASFDRYVAMGLIPPPSGTVRAAERPHLEIVNRRRQR